jgi:TolB-like protein
MSEGQSQAKPVSIAPGPPLRPTPRSSLINRLGKLKGPIAAIAALGAILSGFAGYWTTYKTVRETVITQSAPTQSPDRIMSALPADAGPLSIIVLPFGSLETEAAKLTADGLTASITSDLSRIRDAYIVSATTAQTYRARNLTAQEIGRDLGIRFVLQGNVQNVASKIRINVQLTDASAGAQVWSETFDGDTGDLFALQDKATTLIGNSMGRELVIRAARDSDQRKGDPTLNDLVLRARGLVLRQESLENYQAIESLWRQVLAKDSDHVEAKISLATYLALEVNIFFDYLDAGTRAAKIAEASDLIAATLHLDPENPDIAYAEVSLSLLKRDSEASFRAAQRLLALKPRWPRSYDMLGRRYLDRLDPARATDLLLQGLALDPKRPLGFLLANLTLASIMADDLDAAIAWGEKARAANPTSLYSLRWLACAYALKGQKGKANDIVAQALAIKPDYSIAKVREWVDVVLTDEPYRRWFGDKIVPAMRLAGLPE